MPERTEIYVQHKQLLHFIQHTSSSERHLCSIWVDAVNREAASAAPGSLAREGLVYSLQGGADNVIRGPRSRAKGVLLQPRDKGNSSEGQGGGRGTGERRKGKRTTGRGKESLPQKGSRKKVVEMDSQETSTCSMGPVFPDEHFSSMDHQTYVLDDAPFNPECIVLKFIDNSGQELYAEVRY